MLDNEAQTKPDGRTASTLRLSQTTLDETTVRFYVGITVQFRGDGIIHDLKKRKNET